MLILIFKNLKLPFPLIFRVGLRVQSKLQAKYRRPDETSDAKDEINHREMQEEKSYLDLEPDAKIKTEEHEHAEEVGNL